MTVKPKRLRGLRSAEYEHRLDRMALDNLEKIPIVTELTRKLFEISYEKASRIQYSGSYLQANRENMPRLYGILAEACAILDIRRVPDIFVQWDYSINAMTTGVERPIIVINSGCIDLLSDEELLFVIGHELGHIKSGHVLYRTLASVFPVIVEQASQMTLGIGGLAGTGVQVALNNWYRMSEFSADRAGLLACQSPQASIRSLIRMAGLPNAYKADDFQESFLKQAREFENLDLETAARAVKIFSTLTLSHPWTVLRGSEFLKWTESGEYEKVLDNDSRQPEVPILVGHNYCGNCGFELKLADNYCAGCGISVTQSFTSEPG